MSCLLPIALHERVVNDRAGSGSRRPLSRALAYFIWRTTADEDGHYCFAVAL